MERKSTGQLNQELMQASSLGEYVSENRDAFSEQAVSQLLSELYEKKSISKAALARRAGMSEVYLHQVFSGRRSPSRDRLLCLCLGLEATLEETQELLRQAGFAQLYPRHKRDAVISYGLVHGISLGEINDRLFVENEKTLF
ncbi:helix-turn-helix transcriptional regulator [Flavonifractor sp. An10]|uniref:helix-turn-helix domain-containing protein n=1 Tax=Flavonifractor sp. An10 TaxID=1965537 RepID=UPI000B3A8AE7|nr:helix-turn-helix transcriptional regulator [Flavonifractor sp. An10]OUQ81494.1 hypothetical protein B5E42_12615 [Flavonifractor sp. An10]HJB69969.1 helix-turn-helix domain-containing protein [Candidatus Flavonifractor avistercoris]